MDRSGNLFSKCLLFQHSMLYFFHHYELPLILQQASLQQLLTRNHNGEPHPTMRQGDGLELVIQHVLADQSPPSAEPVPDPNPDPEVNPAEPSRDAL